MVLISDSFSSFRVFLKRTCTFFIINFVFAGFMLAVNIFLAPKNIIYSSGALYYNIGLPFIIILSVLSYFSVVLLSKLTSSKHLPDCLFDAEIHINSAIVKGKAFLDTGNSMSDVFTGKPVILAEKNLILPIVSDEIRLFLSGVSPEKLPLSEKQKTNIRLIPFSSVGGSGLLPSVKCDKLIVNKIHIPDVLIAVTDKPLSTGEFNILLPNFLSQYIKRSPRNEKHSVKH